MNTLWNRIVILAAGLIFLPAIALADNSGWYIAADIGQSHFPNLAAPAAQFFNPYTATYTNNDTGYRLTAGYQFNSYWGLEASYVALGESGATDNIVVNQTVLGLGSLSCGYLCSTDYNVNAKLKAHGWTVAVTGTYPFTDKWAVFGRAGVIDARVELDVNEIPDGGGVPGTPSETNSSSMNWKGTYGLGASWAFVENWALRLDWDRYANLGDNSKTGTYNVNLASLGIVYRF
ncbi:MAG: outer membrane beta-barrel protein [Gammaproteobacteria bacterium]